MEALTLPTVDGNFLGKRGHEVLETGHEDMKEGANQGHLKGWPRRMALQRLEDLHVEFQQSIPWCDFPHLPIPSLGWKGEDTDGQAGCFCIQPCATLPHVIVIYLTLYLTSLLETSESMSY